MGLEKTGGVVGGRSGSGWWYAPNFRWRSILRRSFELQRFGAEKLAVRSQPRVYFDWSPFCLPWLAFSRS